MGQHGEIAGWPRGTKNLDQGRLASLAANPNLLEEMIEANLVVGRDIAAAVGGVDERASERMPGTVLQSIEMQAAVREFDTAVGLAGDVGVLAHHQDGWARVLQPPKNLQHHSFLYLG